VGVYGNRLATFMLAKILAETPEKFTVAVRFAGRLSAIPQDQKIALFQPEPF